MACHLPGSAPLNAVALLGVAPFSHVWPRSSQAGAAAAEARRWAASRKIDLGVCCRTNMRLRAATRPRGAAVHSYGAPGKLADFRFVQTNSWPSCAPAHFGCLQSPSLKPRFCCRSGSRLPNGSLKTALPQDLSFACNPVSCVCVYVCVAYMSCRACTCSVVRCVCACERVPGSTRSYVPPCLLCFHAHANTYMHTHT